MTFSPSKPVSSSVGWSPGICSCIPHWTRQCWQSFSEEPAQSRLPGGPTRRRCQLVSWGFSALSPSSTSLVSVPGGATTSNDKQEGSFWFRGLGMMPALRHPQPPISEGLTESGLANHAHCEPQKDSLACLCDLSEVRSVSCCSLWLCMA